MDSGELMLSIIIPTYNRIERLERLLCTLVVCEYIKHMEIIVVDDCSTPSCEQIVEKYKNTANIIYLRNQCNIYAEKSRKRGFDVSNGKYIIFCDDDDFYVNTEFFNDAVYKLEHNERLAFVAWSSDIYYEKVDEKRAKRPNKLGFIKGDNYLKHFQIDYDKPLSTFTTVFRKESIDATDVFYNDSSIYMYALLHGSAYIDERIAGYYCIHDVNITMNISSDFIIDSIKSKYVIKKHIERKGLFNTRKWWKKQLLLTSKYYYSSKNVEWNEVITYCQRLFSEKIPINFTFLLYSVILGLKKRIKI